MNKKRGFGLFKGKESPKRKRRHESGSWPRVEARTLSIEQRVELLEEKVAWLKNFARLDSNLAPIAKLADMFLASSNAKPKPKVVVVEAEVQKTIQKKAEVEKAKG